MGQRPLFKEVLEIDLVEASSRAVLEMRVRKSGRTTGLTVGTVADVSLDVDVNGYPNGTESFRDQIAIEGSAPGDSGSVWVDDANQVVGLNFAGSPSRAIANHIDAVFTAVVPLRNGWEETEAECEAEAREACDQHLADLQAHAEPPRDVKIPVRFVTCRPMAITLP